MLIRDLASFTYTRNIYTGSTAKWTRRPLARGLKGPLRLRGGSSPGSASGSAIGSRGLLGLRGTSCTTAGDLRFFAGGAGVGSSGTRGAGVGSVGAAGALGAALALALPRGPVGADGGGGGGGFSAPRVGPYLLGLGAAMALGLVTRAGVVRCLTTAVAAFADSPAG